MQKIPAKYLTLALIVLTALAVLAATLYGMARYRDRLLANHDTGPVSDRETISGQ